MAIYDLYPLIEISPDWIESAHESYFPGPGTCLCLKRQLNEYYQRYGYHQQWHSEYRHKEVALEEAMLGLLPLSERLEISDTDELGASTVDIRAHLQRMRERPQLLDRLEDMVFVQHRVRTRYNWVITESVELGRMTGRAPAGDAAPHD